MIVFLFLYIDSSFKKQNNTSLDASSIYFFSNEHFKLLTFCLMSNFKNQFRV